MIEALDKFCAILNRVLTWLASALLGLMVFLTCANIILRGVWRPVGGTVEIMAYAGALVTALALGFTQKEKANIAVDVLVQRLPLRLRKVFACINYGVVGAFFCLIGWQVAKYAGNLKTTGEVSETLRIAYYPFTYGVSFGCFLLALVLVVQFLKVVSGAAEEEL